MSTPSPLFQPYQGAMLLLQNRIVMAPFTRLRAPGNQPNKLMREYCAQRSGAGLIISEGASHSRSGLGYARIPGLFNATQATDWGEIAKAVHAGGGKRFVQRMYSCVRPTPRVAAIIRRW